MKEQFSRSAALLGEDAILKLNRSRVAVFGVGGVGGFVVEALARSGVGAIDLIDADTVSESNINRQIVALKSTVGAFKTEVAKQRILDINPDCKVTTHNLFFLPENANLFNFNNYDYVVDAVDTVSAKIEIITRTKEAQKPVISAMGAGNKLDPTAFKVADISKTKVCPLAKVVRVELRKRNIKNVKTVYSEEEPKTPFLNQHEEARKTTPGSLAFVPSVMGLIIASEVVKDLIK